MNPFGRWNRDPGQCVGEIVSDGAGYCWAECRTHDFHGDPRRSTAEADADMEAHERRVFEVHRGGGRIVRTRFE